MKRNMLVLLTSIMFLASGIASVYAQNAAPVKAEVKAVEKTAGCCADKAVGKDGMKNCSDKEKCICKDCKTTGKCDPKCECCADCKDGKGCKDGKTGCCDKKDVKAPKAEIKKADCGNTQGCSGAMKTGCGMGK